MQIILQEDVEKLGTRGEVRERGGGLRAELFVAAQAGAGSFAEQPEAPGKNSRRRWPSARPPNANRRRSRRSC